MATKTHKNQQNRTKSGLTPTQEQAAIMLASGESITSVAERLELNRSTIYEWQGILTFQCFFNKQCEMIRERMNAEIFGLQEAAIQAIKESLSCNNESIRLKAATWIVERLSNAQIGESDPTKLIKAKCTTPLMEWDQEIFDKNKFERLLEEFNLEEE